MTNAMIQFHANSLKAQYAELDAAIAAEDAMTADMIRGGIKTRRDFLAAKGVVIIIDEEDE